MSDTSAHAQVNREKDAPQKPHTGFQETPGEAQADAARAAVVSSGNAEPPPNSSSTPAGLMRLDPALRAEVVQGWQKEHGNLFVQRRLEPATQAQRPPAGQALVVQRQGTGGGTSASDASAARKELEEREQKAFDAAQGRAGTAAAKVLYGFPLRPPVENETFNIESLVARPKVYPNRLGFDAVGPATAYASLVGAGSGAVVIKQETFFFVAKLSRGSHSLRFTEPSSITEGEWWKHDYVWRVDPMSVVALAGTDGFIFPLGKDLQPDPEKSKFVKDPQTAAPVNADDLRAVAGVPPVGTRAGDKPPMPHEIDIPTEQQEAFIQSYFRARGLEALKSNEEQARKLMDQFKPAPKGGAPGSGAPTTAVSPEAKNLMDSTRKIGAIYRDIIEKEALLDIQVEKVSHTPVGYEVELNGKKQYAWQWRDELREKQKKVKEQKNELLSLTPMLAIMVPAERSAPSQLSTFDKAAYWIGGKIVGLGTALGITEPTVYGANPYDESLLSKEATPENDEKVRQEFLKKLDAILQATQRARSEMLGDIDFLLGMSGLRQQVIGDVSRITGRNRGMKYTLERMLSSHATKELVWNIVGTVVQVGALFLPGGQFISAAIGFGVQAAEMSKHLREWDVSKAAIDPSTALVDQQEVSEKLASDTFWMVVQAIDLAQGFNSALKGLEGGRKLKDLPSGKVDEATEGPRKMAGEGPVPSKPPKPLDPWKVEDLSPQFVERLQKFGINPKARVMSPAAVLKEAGNSWEAVKAALLKSGTSKAEIDAGLYFMTEMTKYRRQIDVSLLKESIAEINARHGTKYTFEDIVEAVGSDAPTSDLDWTVKGPHSGDIVTDFNARFRKQYNREAAVVFDTNVYTSPAYLEYPILPDPTKPPTTIDIVPHNPKASATTGGLEAWNGFKQQTLGKAATPEEGKRLAALVEEAEKLYPNDLGARLRHVNNFQQDVHSHIAACENFLSHGPEGAKKWAQYQEELLAKAPGDKKDALKRVFAEAESRVKRYQDEVVAKLNELFPGQKFTEKELAEMAHSTDPKKLEMYMQARNRMYEEKLGSLSELKERYAKATTEAEKLQIAAQIQAKQNEALYFASEAYQTEGSILSVVQNAQKAGGQLLDPNYGALIASQARAAFFEQHGKAMVYGATLDGEAIFKAGKYTERAAYAQLAHPLAAGTGAPPILGVIQELATKKGKSAQEVFDVLKKHYPAATTVEEALQMHHGAMAATRSRLAGRMIEMSGKPLPDIKYAWEQLTAGGSTVRVARLLNLLQQAASAGEE